MKYLSFIHNPELRFHYRFLSVQHETKKWSYENLPPCDLFYAFLSRSFRFSSHFWPVVWHFWGFNSSLITPTSNSAAKHQLYIEFQITCSGCYERATSHCVTKLKGKNTCGRLVFVSSRSDAGKPFQTAPAHQLCKLERWYVFYRAPLQPWKYARFWPLHRTSIIVSRRLSRRILSKNSLAVQAQLYNVWKGRRKRQAKFKD